MAQAVNGEDYRVTLVRIGRIMIPCGQVLEKSAGIVGHADVLRTPGLCNRPGGQAKYQQQPYSKAANANSFSHQIISIFQFKDTDPSSVGTEPK